MQTSNEIFRFFSQNIGIEDKRSILVRVIVPESEESRDKIIRATNSQTPIPKASLRATDPIHRDIEEYFKPRGLFYDRRKNFYKNEGKKPAEIVSIPFLAQCVMAITMQKPNFARARPSTLLEDDSSYGKLYNRLNDIKSYYVSAVIGKKVELYLKNKDDISTAEKNNIKFYISYVLASDLTNTQFPSFKSLSLLDTKEINTDQIDKAYNLVFAQYKNMGGGDKLAKGKELIHAIKAVISSN